MLLRYKTIPLLLLLSVSTGTVAHDTWLLADESPSAHRTEAGAKHHDLSLLLTTGSEFPALGSTTSPQRLLRANLISDTASHPLLMGDSTQSALQLRALTAANSAVMAVVQLKPAQIELAPDAVALYLEELGGALSIARRYRALGKWRESYSKAAKMWIRVGAEQAPASLMKPMNLPYELVPSVDPTELKAGAKLEVCAFANGKPAGKSYLGLVTSNGKKTMKWSNAKGCTHFKTPSHSAFLLHSISITKSALPGLEWESHFASFTVFNAWSTGAIAIRSTP